MQQSMEKTQEYANNPSLLRQIVDEVDRLSDEEKAALLRKLKMQQVVEKLKSFEKSLTPTSMTEEEIDEMCSATRREMYYEKMSKENELNH